MITMIGLGLEMSEYGRRLDLSRMIRCYNIKYIDINIL